MDRMSEVGPKKGRHLFKPFEVFTARLESWQKAPVVYYFFEIVYVVAGTGMRYVNRRRYPYQAGSVFIFTPQDCRSFEVETASTFHIIRFSHLLFGQSPAHPESDSSVTWLEKMEYIFLNHNRQGIPIVPLHAEDQRLITSVVENIVLEYGRSGLHSHENLMHFITILLNVLHRNLCAENIQAGQSPDVANRIINYIRTHIQEPEKLTISHLSGEFALSKNYIGEYFKKHTGSTIAAYVLQCKIGLAQLKLKYTDLTIAAIASDLGYADESYFYKVFKKTVSITPTAYRKAAPANLLIEQGRVLE